MGRLIKVIGAFGLLVLYASFAQFAGLGENDPLTDFLGVANMLLMIVYIVGAVKKIKLFTWGTYVADIILGFMCIGVVKDKPYFIRSMGEKEFLYIIAALVIIGLPLALLISFTRMRRFLKKNVNKVKQEVYSDSDLMILKGFDRYQMAGYYLLKAKLHNIITYRKSADAELSDPVYYVEINPEMKEEALREYCDANPQEEKIVCYLLAKQEAGEQKTRVTDIIYTVQPTPEIDSAGGKIAFEYKSKAGNAGVGCVLFWLVGLIYLIVTKWMMGVYNTMSTERYLWITIISIGALVIIYGLLLEWQEQIINKVFVDEIIRCNSGQYESISSLHEYKPEEYKDCGEEGQFSGIVFASVAAVRLKVKNETENSESN